MEAKLYGQNKGSMSINGIIKDYYAYAGENISAGDLVEYVNGLASKVDYGESVDTQLSTTVQTGMTISAVKLDNNRAFIAHSYGSNKHLYGVICTISGTTITVGTDTVLVSYTTAGHVISTCYLTNGRVFIAHSYGNYQHLYGMVLSINGTTITKGTDTQLVSANYLGSTISVCKLTNSSVFVAHGTATSGGDLCGTVVTLSGLAITPGTDTVLVSLGVSETISTCLLNNGNVFIAHRYDGGNYHLYGIVCSISDTTITKGTDTQLGSASNTGVYVSTILLPNGNVFIAHSYGQSYSLYGIVCSISGTTITKGSDTALGTSTGAGEVVTTAALNGNNVLIIHSGSNSAYNVKGTLVSIEGTTVTKNSDENLILNSSSSSGAYPAKVLSTIKLDNGTIFVAHNYTNDYYLYAQVFGIDYDNNIPTNNISITEYETQVRQVTTGQFDGVAKTSGEGGDDTGHKDIVSIWTKLNNLIKNGDFSKGLDGWASVSSGVELTVVDNQLHITTVQDLVNKWNYIYQDIDISKTPNGDLCYISCKIKIENWISVEDADSNARITMGQTTSTLKLNPTTVGEWQLLSGIDEVTEPTSSTIFPVRVGVANALTGTKIIVDDFKLYNLTELFGAGNEPTKEWCDANL